jgi:hypothetical protein
VRRSYRSMRRTPSLTSFRSDVDRLLSLVATLRCFARWAPLEQMAERSGGSLSCDSFPRSRDQSLPRVRSAVFWCDAVMGPTTPSTASAADRARLSMSGDALARERPADDSRTAASR